MALSIKLCKQFPIIAKINNSIISGLKILSPDFYLPPPPQFLQINNNLPNLQQTLSQSGTAVANYSWLADGTKCAVADNSGNGYEYLGSLIYRRTGNTLTLESTDFGGGRLVYNGGVITIGGLGTFYDADRYYYITDHLGSVRVITNNSGTVEERNDYYPFGGKHANVNYPQFSVNKQKFNGKELQTTGGTGFLDYGARMYDDVIGRWGVVDRFAEKYVSLTPYHYAANNPIRFIDVNGDSLWISHRGNDILYQNGSLYNKDGTSYTGKGVKTDKNGNVTGYKGFLGQTVSALGSISGTAEGGAMVTELQSSANNFTIVKGSSNEFVANNQTASFANIPEIQAVSGNTAGSNGSGGTIYFNPNSTTSGLNTAGNIDRPSYVGLAHEMFHGRDANQGVLYYGNSYTIPITGMNYQATHQGLEKSEWRAVYYENILRGQAGLPLRTHYGLQQMQNGSYQPTGPRLLDVNNNPENYIVR